MAPSTGQAPAEKKRRLEEPTEKIIEAHRAEFFSKHHIEHGETHNLRVYDDIQQLLSDEHNPTPLVKLNHISPFKYTTVYGKIEWYNPYGSVKVWPHAFGSTELSIFLSGAQDSRAAHA